MERELRQVRTVATQFNTREDGEALKIEGYFAVFNSIYEIADGMTESVAPTAFQKIGDVRALINHDTTLVLGRTKAGTLTLKTDDHGLFGSIDINPKDVDAMNLYERVKRGDVDQCSFGFEIIRENTEIHEDGSIHWTIEEVNLFEVSACTFPAYQETSIAARAKERDDITRRKNEAWKATMKERLKHGTEGTDASQTD